MCDAKAPDIAAKRYGVKNPKEQVTHLDEAHRRRIRISAGVLFVLPVAVYLLVACVFPFVKALSTSFVSEKGQFVGMRYYLEVLRRPYFLIVVRNTFFFTGFTVLFHFLVGLGFALLLNAENLKHRSLWRGLQFLPWLFPPTVAACIWILMYHPVYGVINEFLRQAGLGAMARSWLGDPSLALLMVSITNVWSFYPFFTVMMLAALQSIPEVLHEAAVIDGATKWKRFWHITLPHLKPVILTVALLDTIWTFRFFDLVWIMTKGGPIKASEIFPTAIFKIAFKEFEFGEAAAMGGIMVLFMAFFCFVYLKYYTSE